MSQDNPVDNVDEHDSEAVDTHMPESLTPEDEVAGSQVAQGPAGGEGAGEGETTSAHTEAPEDEPDITDPGQIVRLGHMHAKILEELKAGDTDPAGRKRLAYIHEQSVEALKETLGTELEEELGRFTPKLSSSSTPSHSELVIAQAGLVGWIEGLMQSIQTAIMARQAMAENGEHPHMPPGAPHPKGEGYGPGNYL